MAFIATEVTAEVPAEAVARNVGREGWNSVVVGLVVDLVLIL
jgi:hypothetical protein